MMALDLAANSHLNGTLGIMRYLNRLVSKTVGLIGRLALSALIGGAFAIIAILGSLIILEAMKFLFLFFWIILSHVEIAPSPPYTETYDELGHPIVAWGVKAFGILGFLLGMIVGLFYMDSD
jgi:hypothetical protein